MKTLEQKIEVMQAALDGKEIEFNDCNGDWIRAGDASWNWGSHNFRIKPDPIEFWVNVYMSGRKDIFEEREFADRDVKATDTGYLKTIRVREVIE